MKKRIYPPLKWVGGKTQLRDEIVTKLPKSFNTYFEPFFGGGAILFEVQPIKAVINDLNSELINYYKVIKDNSEELIIDLRKHKNEHEYYYNIRNMDRGKEYLDLSEVERASRLHYLNKTSYSGLYRVNKKGEFNTPFGKYKNPNIVNEEKVRIVSKYFNDNSIKILNEDFETAVSSARKGDFIYFDPPYDVEENISTFTGYTNSGFNKASQIKLKDLCDRLTKKNIKFVLSNSNTAFINELYSDYSIEIIQVNRRINSKPTKRSKSAEEVLIKNY